MSCKRSPSYIVKRCSPTSPRHVSFFLFSRNQTNQQLVYVIRDDTHEWLCFSGGDGTRVGVRAGELRWGGVSGDSTRGNETSCMSSQGIRRPNPSSPMILPLHRDCIRHLPTSLWFTTLCVYSTLTLSSYSLSTRSLAVRCVAALQPGSLDGYLDSIGFDATRRMALVAALCE